MGGRYKKEMSLLHRLDFAGYVRSGIKKSWMMPSLLLTTSNMEVVLCQQLTNLGIHTNKSSIVTIGYKHHQV